MLKKKSGKLGNSKVRKIIRCFVFIDNFNSQKASVDELKKLEKSLDKNMAIRIYNDMQMYVDEAMSTFYQRVTSSLNQKLAYFLPSHPYSHQHSEIQSIISKIEQRAQTPIPTECKCKKGKK